MTWRRCKWIIASVVVGLSMFSIMLPMSQELQIPVGFGILAMMIQLNGWRDWRY